MGFQKWDFRKLYHTYSELPIINWTDKMDPTPNFGVTMISEVPSNPQLTLTLTLRIVKSK